MKGLTFKIGGIHPPENKISWKEKIKTLKVPDQVTIFLNQQLGVPSEPVVNKGDRVKVGSLIGRAKGFISANIHSSVSGIIKKIEQVMDISGYKHDAVVIEVIGDDWEELIDQSPEFKEGITLNSEEIIKRMEEMGIVGMGGAAFPTHIKYLLPEGKKADTLIINGIECEPYLTSDHRLMLERADEILKGIEIMKKAGKVSYAVIGIEANKPDVIELLEDKSRYYPGIEVVSLKVKYPQGAEKQLIKALLNREIPSGGLPMDVGCIINNVGTAYAIYEGVQKNKPLIERVVTITGKNLKKTGNFKVRIGASIRDMLNALGEDQPEDSSKLIMGGPMMGKTVPNIDMPITKGTGGILFLTRKESRQFKTSNCIRCGRCIVACPMGLRPYLLEKVARQKDFERSEKNKIHDCIECGSCSYVCPSSLPLLDYIRFGKVNVLRIIKGRRKK